MMGELIFGHEPENLRSSSSEIRGLKLRYLKVAAT
jgi:hypothetical protein